MIIKHNLQRRNNRGRNLGISLVFGLLLSFNSLIHAQTENEWTWISGSNSTGTAPSYGSMGVASSSNTPGGRNGMASVQDGNIVYAFGGESALLTLRNDLWSYNTSTGEWTWLAGGNSTNAKGNHGTQGTASTSNFPGARTNAVMWKVGNELFIFGGFGYRRTGLTLQNVQDFLNDLWKYNLSTGEWTWLKGSSNARLNGTYNSLNNGTASTTPGSRARATAWSNGNDLFLFGGDGFATQTSGILNLPTQGTLNDLWKYNTSNNTWTWIGGANSINNNGTYGTLGTPSTSNIPRSRRDASVSEDANFVWLYGGVRGTDDYLSDLWRFNKSTGAWTWISGDAAANTAGDYGIKGVMASSNTPGPRSNGKVWVEGEIIWLAGGFGRDPQGGLFGLNLLPGSLNDLWAYNTISGIWTWMSGSDNINTGSNYGTQGVSNANNVPGARVGAISWYTGGHLYMFGGLGYVSGILPGYQNDVWRYVPPTKPQISFISPSFAKAGDNVQINGVNLNGISSLTFGGANPANIVVNNSNSITATIDTGSSGDVLALKAPYTASVPDFLFLKPASTLVRVWEDLNGNGRQDAGEPGIENIRVRLVNVATNKHNGYQRTNSNGFISFGSLDSGVVYKAQSNINAENQFRVTIPRYSNNPNAADDSDNEEGGAVDQFFTFPFSLTSSNAILNNIAIGLINITKDTDNDKIPDYMDPNPNMADKNAVLYRVWQDDNADGLKTPGRRTDVGLGGYAVKLINNNNAALSQTKTSHPVEGYIVFSNLNNSHTYKTTMTLPQGMIPTKVNQTNRVNGNKLTNWVSGVVSSNLTYESANFGTGDSVVVNQSAGLLFPSTYELTVNDDIGPVIDGRFVRIQVIGSSTSMVLTGNASQRLLNSTANGKVSFSLPPTSGAPVGITPTNSSTTVQSFVYGFVIKGNRSETTNTSGWNRVGANFETTTSNRYAATSGSSKSETVVISIPPTAPNQEVLNNENASVSIFPVPAVSQLNVSVDVTTAQNAQYVIIDALGREVLKSEMNLINGNNVISIDIQHLNNGMYLLNILNSEVSGSHRFVVTK